ncbi:MAG: asparagine synthase (glutamine-hydrolyzing) [Rhodospirillales bacterium]|nr:asparagine synthase (glutamine-hydrolyzing) [Rhodospirillales bacterium]
MCGLAGLFFPKNVAPLQADLDAILKVMGHRGPDGEGRFISQDRRYQAGFLRLAIIDLETGDQPIAEDGGKRVLMGNGEIYNYRELRTEEPAYPYKTSGDMEVVLPLAARLGDDFVNKLNGMFALALYDQSIHRLTLVRDRVGVKPLYWAALPGGGVIFASEIKAIFASGLINPAVNEDAVSLYLSHGYVPAPTTLYAGIQKLAPGYMMTVDADGAIGQRRYWRAKPADDLPETAAEIEDHLIELLEDSVRLQLRSDVPVAALLSGGIDSGLMVALAAHASSGPLNTFTVSFGGASVNEAPLAKSVAERYGTHHTNLTVPAGSVAEYLPRLAWFSDEPLNDAAMLPNYLIEQELGHHMKVVLNGTGGDELFAGYGRYFQLPIEAHYLHLPGWLRYGLIDPMMKNLSPMRAWQLNRAGKFDHDRGAYIHEHSTHFPAPVRDLVGNRQPLPEPAQARYFSEYKNSFAGPAQSAALYADLCTYLPDDLLTLLDRTTMAVGVEGRVPFLDHRLVEAALAVPPSIRTPGGRHKALERAMAARYLPDAVLNAPKQGFASPVPAWMKAGLGPLAKRILTRPATLERGWWTKAGIDKLLANPDRHGFRVYTLLMLELCVRIHVERPTGPVESLPSLEDLADAA